MPQAFRIALGRASCRTGTQRPVFKAACGGLLSRLETLRRSSIERLRELPDEGKPEIVANGTETTYTTYRKVLEDGALLIVVQAFVRTLAWPTHFSFSGIGRIYAEGFVVSENGDTSDAPDELLWEFR